jgi:hypothetical protein
MLARHAVLLTPSVTARLSRPSREAEHTFRATNPLPSVQYCLSPLDATLTKTQGVGAHDSGTHHSALITRHCSQVLSFHTLAHSFAPRKTQLVCFQLFPHSLSKNTGGGGVPYILTSLPPYFPTSKNGRALPAAMGAAAKRAYRLQERSSCPALNQLSGGGGGGGASGPPLNW